ncbi:hypothetical protein CW362_40935 [Streptomyces populi]|uniref:Uncharacterized protein n=1 Tax=Streptomyces populi TaxID=2058924 RepID=A0A2I0SBT2_9ACTN|nr:hypothetical protein [Streptomyces populi]PKT67352.1 hypothetical protein CW362_40935 [Streptomyces populi]
MSFKSTIGKGGTAAATTDLAAGGAQAAARPRHGRMIMGRRTGGVVLAAVLAVPAMLLGSAEQASAANGGTVTWRNHKNDFFLSAHGGRVWDDKWAGVSNYHLWSEYQNSDGSWNLLSNDGQCLVGFNRQVYTEPCNPRRDQTNHWQRWYEVATKTGWALKNRQTGRILDDAGDGSIYANDNDAGNGDPNQRWY